MVQRKYNCREILHPLSSSGQVVPSALALAVAIATSTALPAFATIDNTVVVSGAYAGNPVEATDTVQVPVALAAPGLSIVKTAGVPNLDAGGVLGQADAGDTITYTYVVTNDGNVTLTDVLPVDSGPTFNGVAGSGTLAAFAPTAATLPVTLAPGEFQEFTAVYTMTDADAYNAADVPDGIANTATASATTPLDGPYDDLTESTALTGFAASPVLEIDKTSVFGVDGGTADVADVGDTIIYTYTVTNIGNVATTDVTISDLHEGTTLTSAVFMANETWVSDVFGTSTDAAFDGSWDLLQPGGVIKFTYTHTVTQTEVDGG